MAEGSNSSTVSIVAILAILVLVGLVLYFVFTPGEGSDFELNVDVDTLGLVQDQAVFG